MKIHFKIGTRSSPLALIQAEAIKALLSEKFPKMDGELVQLSSPGDRDKTTDLVTSPGDFFTRDLDQALLDGTIDCAVHSAKDLPDELPEGIDFVWLPVGADPRDVLVGSRSPRVIGVSSQRRIEYAQQRFPEAECKPLRGTIEERLQQLDHGEYDAILMAAAALHRLGLENRISEYIELSELSVPDGQGRLALTFRRADENFMRMRSLFVKPVTFVSAGPRAGLCTQEGIAALRQAEICLYDALLDDTLLNELPVDAEALFVGKRSGNHRFEQPEICAMLTRYARQGKRVVRLKGGDAGLYGRLAEEVDALDVLELPYRVIPGVSSLSSATTGTGLLLTRRGVADRVRIISGHPSVVSDETVAVFMGIQSLAQTVERLLAEGKPSSLPVSVVFDAAMDNERIVSGTLGDIVSKTRAIDSPGLVLAGPSADQKYLYRPHGALRGKRVWLTCSASIQERAAQAVYDFGGIPIQQPLIELLPEKCPSFESVDWLIVTSPSAVRCLMDQIDDLRALPKILCCGIGTARALTPYKVQPDAMPEGQFNTAGVLRTAPKHIPKDARILRVRSDRAGESLSKKLRETFDHVDDYVICKNRFIEAEIPPCDIVFFASVSAVESFMDRFGVAELAKKEVAVIGELDAEALRARGVEQITAPKMPIVEDAVEAIACANLNREFL